MNSYHLKQSRIITLLMVLLNSASSFAGSEINYKEEGSLAKDFVFYEGKDHAVAVAKARAYISSLIDSNIPRGKIVQPKSIRPGFSVNMIQENQLSGPGYTRMVESDGSVTYLGKKQGLHLFEERMTIIQLDKHGERMSAGKSVSVVKRFTNSLPYIQPEYSRVESKTFNQDNLTESTSTSHVETKLTSSQSRLSNEYPMMLNEPYESSGEYESVINTVMNHPSVGSREMRHKSKSQRLRVCVATGLSNIKVADRQEEAVRTVCASVQTSTMEIDGQVRPPSQLNLLFVNYFSTKYGTPLIYDSVNKSNEGRFQLTSIKP